jgi:Cd2+/Zn2+-exporting ATPase
MDLRPDIAHVLRENGIEDIAPEQVAVGETLIVKPGERIPVDGTVIEGASSLDAAALTGESVPVEVTAGDRAVSGCINQTGLIKIRTESLFENSTASRILDLVENATENKSKSDKFITRFAHFYTPIVVIAALVLAFVPPILSGHFSESFSAWCYRALTFLIVSCPCALVVSVPLTFFCGIGKAGKNGILIKGANFIDALSSASTVVLDKTGTLTHGVFEVSSVEATGCSESELLHLAAAAESFSLHPIALSLKAAYDGNTENDEISDVSELAGKGVKAAVNGKTVFVGNKKLLESLNIAVPKVSDIGTAVFVADESGLLGTIIISDKIKSDAKSSISLIRQSGVKKVVMLTGDRGEIAEKVASETGIDSFYAELLPDEKVEKIEQFINEKQGGSLIFAGDGINDAPAIARADVGIAMGALGSQAAIEAADVVLMDDSISKISLAVSIAKRTLKIAKQNIVLAIGVKLIILLLASFGLTPLAFAVFADVGVLVLAVINAMRALK